MPVPPKLDGHVLVGVIGSAHGIRGEVSITTFTEDPAAITAFGVLTDGQRAIEIVAVRVTPKTVLARIKGVEDRSRAEAFRNVPLFVRREALPEIADDDTYYHEDLKGLAVLDASGKRIGEVVEVANFGAGNLLEIALIGQTQTAFFPFTDPVVPNVDLSARCLTLIVPPETGGDEREAE